jgi:hypothetical protein
MLRKSLQLHFGEWLSMIDRQGRRLSLSQANHPGAYRTRELHFSFSFPSSASQNGPRIGIASGGTSLGGEGFEWRYAKQKSKANTGTAQAFAGLKQLCESPHACPGLWRPRIRSNAEMIGRLRAAVGRLAVKAAQFLNSPLISESPNGPQKAVTAELTK